MPKIGADTTGLAKIKITGIETYSFDNAALVVDAGAPVDRLVPIPAAESTTGALLSSTPPAPLVSDQSDAESSSSSSDDGAAATHRRGHGRRVVKGVRRGAVARGASGAMDTSSSGSDDEEDERLDVDEAADRRELADETSDPAVWGAGPAVAPTGFVLAEKPDAMPAVASLTRRKVLWALPVARRGSPGWIMSEVAGGPPDPSKAAMGITMRLKCTRRLDKETPDDLLNESVEVPFNLDNYRERWWLLSAEST